MQTSKMTGQSYPAKQPLSVKEAINQLENLKQHLGFFNEASTLLTPFARRLRVQCAVRENLGDPHHTVPFFTLCGNWLKSSGFHEKEHIRIITLKDLLIIFPETRPAGNADSPAHKRKEK